MTVSCCFGLKKAPLKGKVYATLPAAVSAALALVRQGKGCELVMWRAAIRPPADAGVSRTAWYEGWVDYLNAHAIPFRTLPTEPKQPAEVREYRRAQSAIAKLMKKHALEEARVAAVAAGKHMGRPPFGYRSKDGLLEIDPDTVHPVRTVFGMLDGPVSVSVAQMLRELRRRWPKIAWSRKKIQRLVAHRPLYAHGAHKLTNGEVVTDSSLAILHVPRARRDRILSA